MALIWSTSSGATGISLCRWTIGCTSKPMTAEPRISTFGICSLGQTNEDRKSTRLNSSHSQISYAVFCLKKKKLVHQQRFQPHRVCQIRNAFPDSDPLAARNDHQIAPPADFGLIPVQASEAIPLGDARGR